MLILWDHKSVGYTVQTDRSAQEPHRSTEEKKNILGVSAQVMVMRGWVEHTGNHTGAEVQIVDWTHRQMCAEWKLVAGIGVQSHCSRMQTVENKDHWNRLRDTIRMYRLECGEITWLDASLHEER